MKNDEINKAVEEYLYYEQKLKALRFTFGNNSVEANKCEKDFEKIRHFVIENKLEEFLLEKFKDGTIKQTNFDEFGHFLSEIIQKDPINELSDIEFNILCYYTANALFDLNEGPVWDKHTRRRFFKLHKEKYFEVRRPFIIDNIIS